MDIRDDNWHANSEKSQIIVNSGRQVTVYFRILALPFWDVKTGILIKSTQTDATRCINAHSWLGDRAYFNWSFSGPTNLWYKRALITRNDIGVVCVYIYIYSIKWYMGCIMGFCPLPNAVEILCNFS